MVNAKYAFQRKALVLSLSSALGLMAANNAFSASDGTLELDIKEQKAGPALMSLGESAGIQIVFSGDLARNATVSAVNGSYSLDSALDQMLQNTGLVYEYVSENTVLIKAEDAAEEEEGESSEGKGVDEEIVVTGTLLRNVSPTSPTVTITREQIERYGASTAEDIIRRLPQNFAALNSATSLLGDVDRTDDSIRSNGGTGLIGTQAADLRGLGPNSTLILLNGRRIAATPVIENGFINLSTIPASAIERVEVLLDGASAIYGSDAIGGVINFITRDDYVGAETGVRYENALNGGNQYRLTQTLGFNWETGNASITMQRQESEGVSSFKAGFTSRDFTSIGGPDLSRDFIYGAFGPTAPGTVWDFAPSPAPDILPPGRPTDLIFINEPPFFDIVVRDPFGALPAGTIVNDGNIDTSLFTVDNARSLTEEGLRFLGGTSINKNSSFTARVNQSIGPVALYADLLYSATDNLAEEQNTLLAFIGQDNFYNPFDQDVIVEYQASELPPKQRQSDQERINATLGAKFGLMGDWQADISVTFGEESSFSQEFTIGGANPIVVIAANLDQNRDGILDFGVDTDGDGVIDDNMLTSSDPDVAFNPFGAPGSRQSRFFTADLIGPGFSRDVKSRSEAFKALFNGSLMELPGGVSQLAIGMEYRHNYLVSSRVATFASDITDRGIEIANPDFDATLPVDETTNPDTLFVDERGQKIKEFFAEVSLPVVGENNSLPGMQSLLFTLAARYSSYEPDFIDTTFSNTSPKVGLRWGVTDDLVIQASWGESFRAPTVEELVEPLTAFSFDNGFSPLTPVEVYLISRGILGSSFGGNPNLGPEVSTSTTVALQWSPSQVDGLDLNITYSDFSFEERISGFSANTFGTNFDELDLLLQIPGVVRFAPSDLNQPIPLFPVAGDTFFQGPVNSASRTSRSVDVGIAYDFDTEYGAFKASLNGTRTLELSDEVFAGAPLIEYTGTDAAPSPWVARANLAWNRDSYGADLFVNYTSSYDYRRQDGGGTCQAERGCVDAIQRVEPYTTYDVTGYYNFDESGWKLLGGVRNLTNTGFPRVFTASGPWDASRVDLRGRIMYLEVKKEFDLAL